MSVKEKTVAVVATELKVPYEHAEEACSLKTDLGCDEFDLMTITVEIEDVFGISISDDEMDKVLGTMDLVRLTQTKVNALGAL